MKRLLGIEKRMDKDKSFAEKYCAEIKANVDKGYARRLTSEEAKHESSRTWYLPHFVALNPNKPDKFRVVFDAAAKSHGVNLNDHLLTGPDLQNSLIGLLIKFRQKEVAIVADIKEFFPQILIRREDQQSQRFSWREMDRDKDPDVYEVQVLMFGATCAPYVAQEIRNKNATLFKEEFPTAARAIIQNHYMDDYIDSIHSVEDSLKVMKEVTEVHREGGFEICNWMSNSEEFLNSIPVDMVKNGDKEIINEFERILGLFWSPNKDEFSFALKFHKVDPDVVSGKRNPTKREVLKLLMSIYDPLGFVAPFTVRAKILLQDVWRTNIGWDDVLPDPLDKKWTCWIQDLENISKILIPRCYSYGMKNSNNIQLHLFCDSSEKAFSTVAYLRTETPKKVDVSFVIAKTRVAPLRPMSIPRLELQASVMAARLSETLKMEIDLTIDHIHFWTDSSTVISWLTSEARKFKTFVAHRVGEVQELTETMDWHWIPTKLNPADDATRDSKPIDLSSTSRWICGPDFLRLPADQWPKKIPQTGDTLEEEMEMRPNQVNLVVDDNNLPKVNRLSSWLKLIRSTAWMLRFYSTCKMKVKSATSELMPSELELAERLWVKQVQWQSFQEEMNLLTQKKEIGKSSKLYKLSPFLDKLGIMRIQSRLQHAKELPLQTRNPIILDPKHPYTKLLISYHHFKSNHNGREKVLNDLRQSYWILKARAAVKKSWNDCQYCRLWKAKPQVPEMGQLPYARIQVPHRPFRYCDYFGPITVTIGRRHEKRYGVLFTCLSTRAIHLELAPSLTTDAAINAIRRMINRRGTPTEVYSDNGTNLRGADTELKKALDDLDQVKIQQELTPRKIEWHFIPPSAPHMGGSWERMVKSVKTSIRAVLNQKAPKEDDLMTFFTEAENLVNSRPLTRVSDDPDDDECLTPNHFLIGSSGASQTPGEFTDRDLNFRNRWKYAQRLTDHFWKRWLNEYLPTLTNKTKWHEKVEPVSIGDIVLIIDNNTPRNTWPKGRIIELHPGQDGRVRVVTVKTENNILKRPVAKLCVIARANPMRNVATPGHNIRGENVDANLKDKDKDKEKDKNQ